LKERLPSEISHKFMPTMKEKILTGRKKFRGEKTQRVGDKYSLDIFVAC
jgi:hypothetical protein